MSSTFATLSCWARMIPLTTFLSISYKELNIDAAKIIKKTNMSDMECIFLPIIVGYRQIASILLTEYLNLFSSSQRHQTPMATFFLFALGIGWGEGKEKGLRNQQRE